MSIFQFPVPVAVYYVDFRFKSLNCTEVYVLWLNFAFEVEY